MDDNSELAIWKGNPRRFFNISPIGHHAASIEKSAQKTSPKREKKRVIAGTSCFLGSNGRGLRDDFIKISQMTHLGPTRRASGTLPPPGPHFGCPGGPFWT